MANDPYGPGGPYSSWRSGSWGQLMDRSSPLDRVVGKDQYGDISRADQIRSNFAGAAQFLADDDTINKLIGGEQKYSLNTARGLDLYKKNLLKRAQEEWDSGVGVDKGVGWKGGSKFHGEDGAYKDFDAYIASNPIYAAAQQDKLFFNDADGWTFEDNQGNLVGLQYDEDDEYHFDPSTLWKNELDNKEFRLGDPDEGYKDLMSYMGFATNEVKMPKLDSEGNILNKYFLDNDGDGKFTPGVDNMPSTVYAEEGKPLADSRIMTEDQGEGWYMLENPIDKETKNLWKRGDDFSTDFMYDYGRDYTLKNLADKDWRKDKISKAKGWLDEQGDKLGQAWDNFKDKTERGITNTAMHVLSNKYDKPVDAFDELLTAHGTDGAQAVWRIGEQVDILDSDGNKLEGDDKRSLLNKYAVGDKSAFEGYDVQWGEDKDLYGLKKGVDKETKHNQRLRAQDYIDKGWAPDDTIDRDTYEELGGTHRPADGSWDGFGANFGKEFHANLEGKIDEFGDKYDTWKRKRAVRDEDQDSDGIPDYIDTDTLPPEEGPREGTGLEKMGANLTKAWGQVKDDFASAKEDLSNIPGSFMHDVNQAIYQDDEEGVTYAPLSEQIENQINIQKQEKEDWLNSQVSEVPETEAEQYERLNQVTLEGDPTEWDSRRGLGDNLLRFLKGDFASPDDTLTAGTTQWGSSDSLESLVYDKNLGELYTGDELREMKKRARGMTVDDQRAMWDEKFKELGVSWEEFKNAISEGVDDVKSDYESWKSKRAVRDVDEDSDGIPDFIDADTQPLEQGAREGTFLEKTGAKLENIKEGLLQKYGGGEYKEARIEAKNEAKVNKFYEENPDRNRAFDEDIKKELQTHGGKKILTRKMQLDPAYRDYVKKYYPSIYELYANESEETSQNNLMQAWENEQLDMEPEWEGGSSGTNYYGEENFNFNPGGL